MPATILTDPILIIEDDRNTAALIATYLEREGFATLSVHDGTQALAHGSSTTSRFRDP